MQNHRFKRCYPAAGWGLFLLMLAPQLAAEERAISGTTISYHQQQGQAIHGYLVRPTAAVDKRLPALILIHEWWGLNADIRRQADRFASQGYIALAVDLYRGKNTQKADVARQLASQVRGNMDAAFANLRAAFAYLQRHPAVDSQRIGSVGWCFGGGWSYQIARNNLGSKASVIYYGRFNPSDDLAKMRSEIIGHFAANDRGISIDTVKTFQATLKTLRGEHAIYIYPNTGHGFASRPDDNPHYVAAAADQAWQRTLEFLNKRLQ